MTTQKAQTNILNSNTADSGITDPAASASDTRKTGAGGGFLLYNRRPVLSRDILESLKEAEMITGINQGEIRMRLLGQGIGAFNINRSIRELEECAAGMQSLGINAGVIAKDLVKKALLPAAARHVDLTGSSMTFFNGNKDPVFEITNDTDLLVIITDLSGKAVRQIMTAMAYTGHAIDKKFDEILKKISIAKPAAIFYALNTPSAEGVYVDSDLFSYMGLNDKLTHSKGINFRVMVHGVRALSRSCITDENFGISLLPGASPDWSRGKSSVENDLGKYARYILTAIDQKLLPFAPEPGTIVDKEFSDSVSGISSGTSYAAGSNAAKGLEPPPDMNYSRIAAFFQTSLPEIIVGLVVIASPFHFLTTGAQSISDHPVFWKTVVGSGFLLAGFLIFCHSLLLLYYRRMIENTPTSKVRSLSMGMVELAGNARLFYDLKTSATKTPCVYYQCRYYKYQRTGDRSGWALTRSVSSGKIPFYIEDDTGRVLIKPKGAVFNVPLTTQSFRGSYVPSLSLQLHDPNTKVIEKMIPAGSRLYVLGSAHIEKHGRKFKDILSDKLRTLKQSPETLAEYDINGDGRIDMDEWESARGDAERMVYAESLANGAGQSESVVIEKPRFGMLPFIIADSEKKMVQRLMIRTLVFLAGGLVTMGFSIGFLAKLF